MFSKFFIITALATCCLAARMPPGDVERIIGGKDIDIKEAPYQVFIRSQYQICGGVIYSNNIILTAAHCIKNEPAESFAVRAGSTLKYSGGTEILVDAVRVHEGYEYPNLENVRTNDIAVLHLSRPLELSESIQPIRLSEETPSTSTDAFVSGWGKTKYLANAYPDSLRGADLKIFDQALCAHRIHFYLTRDMLCAYSGGKSTYSGDSGGPLVVNYKSSQQRLIGIVSFGNPAVDAPSVYADVAVLRPWIEDAVRELGGTVQQF